MSATFVPPLWPAPAAPLRGAGWQFGREIAVSARPGAPRGVQWLLRSGAAPSPRQLMRIFMQLALLSLGTAGLFVFSGAPLVLAVAALELLGVAGVMWVCARHAGDRETLTLIGGSLLVERAIGTRTEHATFSADQLSVEPAGAQNSLVELIGQGRTLRVGRFLRPELRSDFARELRQALRQAPARPQDKN